MSIGAHETVRMVDIAGSTIKVIDAGEGEVVLLGHSYLWDAEMWRPQINALSKHYRVIAPDLWGHGGSGPLPVATRDMTDIARHYLDLLDHLGIDRFTMVGLSAGGMWGTELALAASDRVTGLALMDTFVGVEPEASRQVYLAILDVLENTPEIPAAVLDAVVPLFFAPDIEARLPHLPRDFRQRLVNWGRVRLLASVVPLGRMIVNRRCLLDDLEHLAMPSLVITGAKDIPRPAPEGRRMAKMLGCPFVQLTGVGHISSLEAPMATTKHLLAFLQDVHAHSDQAAAM